MRIFRAFINRLKESITRELRGQIEELRGQVEESRGQIDLSISLTRELREASAEKIRLEVHQAKQKQIMAFADQNGTVLSQPERKSAFSEEMLLKECDIQQLLAKLEDVIFDCKRGCIASSMLGFFLNKKEGVDLINDIGDWEEGNLYQKLFLFHPRSTYQFLKQKQIFESIRKIRDEIVFLMPYIDGNTFQVIWDHGFGDIETDGNSFYRWYIGEDHIGQVIVYNDFDCYKPVKIQFESYMANPKAGIIVKCGSYTKIMASGEHEFEIETVLSPGHNKIEIIFCGEICNLNEAEQRKCQFTVTNFRIADMEKDVLYSGQKMYERQYDSSYLDYILSERYIRKKLHENGCFEIESFQCPKNGSGGGICRVLQGHTYHMADGMCFGMDMN